MFVVRLTQPILRHYFVLHPDCADCHDCHGSTFFGTVAERDRLAAADRGVRKFAIKHYLHRDCSGKRPPGYEPG